MKTDEQIYTERIEHAEYCVDFWMKQFENHNDANSEAMLDRSKRMLSELKEWADARRECPCSPISLYK